MTIRTKATRVLILLASLLVSACGADHVGRSLQLADSLNSQFQRSAPNEDAAPVSEVSEGQFGCPAGTPPAGELRLFLDATRSMEGFTGRPNSFTKFDETLARISTHLGIDSIILFGETSEDKSLYQQVPFTPDLHEPHTYERLNNPDYCLAADLARDSAAVSLYLTDGVQSSGVFGPQAPMVRTLNAWLEMGRSLYVVAFSSEFSGPAWSEQKKAWIGRADVESRPYYLFIFATSPGSGQDIVERLGSVIPDSTLQISYTPDPVSCAIDLQYVKGYYQKEPEDNWVFYKSLRPSPANRQLSERFEPGAVSCSFKDGYPLESMVAETEAEYYAWRGGREGYEGPVTPPPGTDIRSDSVTRFGRDGTRIPVRAQVPIRHGIGMYALELDVTPGRILPEVHSLSTDSDSNLDDFERTYRFDWLVESLVQSQLDDVQFRYPLFVLVEP